MKFTTMILDTNNRPLKGSFFATDKHPYGPYRDCYSFPPDRLLNTQPAAQSSESDAPKNHVVVQSETDNTCITVYSNSPIILPKEVLRDLHRDRPLIFTIPSEPNSLKLSFATNRSTCPLVGYTLNWLFRHLVTEGIASMEYLVSFRDNLKTRLPADNQIIGALNMVLILEDCKKDTTLTQKEGCRIQ